MLHFEELGLLIGAIALGAVHGVEPGHGWPVAASYALDQTNKWLYGFAASFILGVGHLISSIAMVGVFFYAKDYFSLTQVNEPITVVGGVQIGGPVSLVAGVLLIGLGIREYTRGHSHGSSDTDHDDGVDHHQDHSDVDHHQDHSDVDHHQDHSDVDHHQDHSHTAADSDDSHTHDHGHSHDDQQSGLVARLKAVVPFVGGDAHTHGDFDQAADRGLLGIAWFAFVLGFAHEEEFEIIAICAGSNYCLELMGAYAITVIVGIVGLTMLLIAGYQHSAETVERYTPYLPAFSAIVLIGMGLGFISGIF
jgi:ABC-type nickel/cobalt efflux system permease component RcnA